ncbi:uncharacterized protein LOC122723577 isoform X1 [Manihot esculenta]|uniref:uncharacterized protein LOC122723577 isoform X1 n=1 Tax=Manihot esculenta TaxID=3983 RepID=UPI001CC45B9A|nr:uncharacterized protein LOC122723577 isoform X1 [Manihot esculenta]
MMNKFWWGGCREDGRGMNWLSWDRMCGRKSEGGMGFRDLASFNTALLGKQGWRLLVDTNSLLYRVLKAKYFSNGDFLSARLGSNYSFVWKSILSSQQMLQRGVRWRIGDGKQVFVVNCPWIPRDIGFMPLDEAMFVPEAMRVCDLFVEEKGLHVWLYMHGSYGMPGMKDCGSIKFCHPVRFIMLLVPILMIMWLHLCLDQGRYPTHLFLVCSHWLRLPLLKLIGLHSLIVQSLLVLICSVLQQYLRTWKASFPLQFRVSMRGVGNLLLLKLWPCVNVYLMLEIVFFRRVVFLRITNP